jgi:hypothetical protein
MGLDMYLEARKYFSKFDYKSDSEEKLPDYTELTKFFPEGSDELGSHAGAHLEITVGYWRKANAIHAWFVRECANGVDECQPIPIRDGKLRELKVIIEYLMDIADLPSVKEEIEKLLPPTAGFFFGDTEINEYYWADLQHTLDILNRAIDLEENQECSITYQASW